ncbi:ribonuclease P protein component [Alloscardovia omnicolens]|uniref:Ribonuclease P protein component n=2 Tax=Alloscardovia omnicolens TaxID=419015 RepID=U1RCK0_9BIFI|nr:ribonuclease P protein component [Alloscardovia omnicolens]ERH31771.1 ribonuclease P protein component [Alloscardovia omnicolens F0580]MDK6445079.1 ribonuclease P protein component [Alloscardovia omnicolens]MDK6522352.1 ribonuclease P protein component [Alloscardovia omnicolens]MDK6643512.1 ribonuclease P protein component [Alloscardovia omnicolens]MDU3532376.1 ribonuclease P protein component [Alloscardovia omnicolens]
MERLKSHQDFTAVLKKRHKVSQKDIVVHFVVTSVPDSNNRVDDLVSSTAKNRLGLAVTKSVGNAVKRNAVKRRFRVLARRYEHLLPSGYSCDIIMRAKPSCYCVAFEELDRQVHAVFTKIAHRVTEPKDAA